MSPLPTEERKKSAVHRRKEVLLLTACQQTQSGTNTITHGSTVSPGDCLPGGSRLELVLAADLPLKIKREAPICKHTQHATLVAVRAVAAVGTQPGQEGDQLE